MTHFTDLSTYIYSEEDRPTLNIGWLDREYEYTKGPTPTGLIDALANLTRNPVNVHRGMHFCNLCPDFQTAREKTSRGTTFIGSGEVRVPGQNGVIYTSPTMIVHYVEAHNYLPPREYCEAVLTLARGE
ncbi:hypothetical protein ACFVTY_29255 [Streptomyces sp. NPDC058067]|uniref:DUF7919 family protein n=1 Tax=Streptomyces sp. NPDC058067 TaxID=3346324 RepID=UPI0036EFBE0C